MNGVAHGELERPRWQVVALIDDHQPVAIEQRGSVGASGERLVGSDVDDAGRFRCRGDSADLAAG